jgi:putative ABC transport system permease protein
MKILHGYIKQKKDKKHCLPLLLSLPFFIACLGLFGLSAFAISQRVKEIGIRKVLGANVSTIVTLLSKDFLKLVGLSAVIAFPVAWFAMNKWLQDFAYRIDMPVVDFYCSGDYGCNYCVSYHKLPGNKSCCC